MACKYPERVSESRFPCPFRAWLITMPISWAVGLVVTHIFDPVSYSYSYSVKRYSYSKHPGIIEYEYEYEYEYRPVD